MKNYLNMKILALCVPGLLFFSKCTEKKAEASAENMDELHAAKYSYGGFESQLAWGEHLVLIGGCHDCHTPKKLTSHGPALDTALWLSGHPANMPKIAIDRSEVEAKGLAVAMDLTEWVGPWGVSYSANLTPDPTGIGNWTEEQFIYALREGKSKGIPGSRSLLPPMPWEMIRHMTDDELKAVFAYLNSVPPINNIVPAPLPPMSASAAN